MERDLEKTSYMSDPVKVIDDSNDDKNVVLKCLHNIFINRNDFNAYYKLGLYYKKIKNYKKAIDYFEKATQISKDFNSYYESGVCNLILGIPSKAIKCFVNAIQLNPENSDAILQLGISHELCEEYDMALLVYEKLIENAPKFIKAYEHKSSLLMKMERYKDASYVLKRIMDIDSKYTNAYVGIGICFDKLGKKNDAQRFYRKFLVNDPNSSQASFVKDRMLKLRKNVHSNVSLSLI